MARNGDYYTLASWHVREGAVEAFIQVWREELAGAFLRANADAQGTLIQSMEDPQQFYSFGPWNSLDEMEQARTHPEVRAALLRVLELCDRAQPGPYRVVLRMP